jgi:hypothetical protein
MSSTSAAASFLTWLDYIAAAWRLSKRNSECTRFGVRLVVSMDIQYMGNSLYLQHFSSFACAVRDMGSYRHSILQQRLQSYSTVGAHSGKK